LVLFILLFATAPLIAQFYDEPLMVKILHIVSINFLVLPFCTISLSLLRRDLAFRRLMDISLASTTISAAVSIGMAMKGFGPIGLAIASVVGNLVTGFGAWLSRSGNGILLPSLSQWRIITKFGGQNIAANLLTTISMDINDLATGKILGFTQVAVISRAQGLMNIFHRDIMAAIRNVTFPAFSKAHRESKALDASHTFGVSTITAIAWPFYGFLALFPLEILRLMFGAQWDTAKGLVPIYCLAGAIAATANLVMNVVMAAGRNDLVAKTEIIYQPLRAAIIVASAIIFKTTEACAWAYAICFFLHPPLVFIIKDKCLPTDYALLRRGVHKSAAVTVISLLPSLCFALHAGLARTQPIDHIFLAVAALSCMAIWVVIIAKINHPIAGDPLYIKLKQKLTFNHGKSA